MSHTNTQAQLLAALGTRTATLYDLATRMGTSDLRAVRQLIQRAFKAGIITTDYRVGEPAAYRLI